MRELPLNALLESNTSILLLKKGAEPDDRDKDGQSALCKAASRGNVDLVKILLSAGAAVDLPDQRGETPLIKAATQGPLPVVRALLEAGADVNHRDKAGKTALQEMNSFYWGKKEIKGDIIKALTAAGGV